MLPIMPQKIALLGGTFDPVHMGHLCIAEWVQHSLKADRVMFIPAAVPPHKQHQITPAAQRLQMLERALADNRHFDLCTLELERQGPSYTLDTLQTLKATWPADTQFWWVMGLDSLLQLHTWHRYREFPHYARLAVTPRPEQTISEPAEIQAHIRQQLPEFTDCLDWVDMPRLAIASSEIRMWRRQGQSCRYLLPPGVWDYIEAHRLYGPTPEIC